MTKHIEQNGGGPALPQTSLSPCWTRRQVAAALGLCTRTVGRYTLEGKLACIRLNRRCVRYRAEDVERFLLQGASK